MHILQRQKNSTEKVVDCCYNSTVVKKQEELDYLSYVVCLGLEGDNTPSTLLQNSSNYC